MTNFTVMVVNHQGEQHGAVIYNGSDYLTAFNVAVATRMDQTRRGQWIRFDNGKAVKWSRIY